MKRFECKSLMFFYLLPVRNMIPRSAAYLLGTRFLHLALKPHLLFYVGFILSYHKCLSANPTLQVGTVLTVNTSVCSFMIRHSDNER